MTVEKQFPIITVHFFSPRSTRSEITRRCITVFYAAERQRNNLCVQCRLIHANTAYNNMENAYTRTGLAD